MMRSNRAVVTGAAHPTGQHSRANHRGLQQEQREETQDRRRPPGHCICEIAGARHIRQRVWLRRTLRSYDTSKFALWMAAAGGTARSAPKSDLSGREQRAKLEQLDRGDLQGVPVYLASHIHAQMILFV
jgi:hypothetical protein